MGKHEIGIDQFLEVVLVDIVTYGKIFVENADKEEKHTFCAWMEEFLAWMKWNQEDCKEFYGEE